MNIDDEIEGAIPPGFATQEEVEDVTKLMADRAMADRLSLARDYRLPITTNNRTKAHLFQRTFSGVPAWVCHGKGEISFGLTKQEAFARWHDLVAFRRFNRMEPLLMPTIPKFEIPTIELPSIPDLYWK